LEDLSRAPQHSPHQTPATIVEILAEARRRHPNWGARKLIRWLQRRRPTLALPSPSTACDILKHLGLITPRRRKRHLPHLSRGLTEALAPNQVWTADFKGQFRTKDGRYCYPLTVADCFSRYLLGCRSQLSVETIPTKKNFQRLFKQYGLPQIIRTDNGVPFAAPTAISRLSRLSVWWIRLGIRPELIQPSHPEQNGRHERMHRTLKAETTRPPAANARAQQRLFDSFRLEFNGLTRPSRTNCPPTSTNPPRDPSPTACLSPSTPDTSRSGRSARTAASAGKKAGSTSATACSSSSSA
jgi:transposase InsO family protein